MLTDPLIFTRFSKYLWKAPVPSYTSKTRRMVGSPDGYEQGKRYLLPRSLVDGKPWWVTVNGDPRDSEVVAEFHPEEKYIDNPQIEPIRVTIPNSPSNYVDGEIYLIAKSEAESNPYWAPI